MMERGSRGDEPEAGWQRLILIVEHLGNNDGLGWCPTVDLWKTRGHHGDKFAWRKGVSDSILPHCRGL